MKILYLMSLILLTCCSKTVSIVSGSSNEVVMIPGMTILATNKAGTIKIKAGQGYERFYSWDGGTRSQVLEPRLKRWAGRLGAGYSKVNMWKKHDSITNANLEEAQIHVTSIEEAINFARHRSRLDGYTVYNDNGLVVTWKKVIHPSKTSGNVIIVYVWQLLINGEAPIRLPDSNNSQILVSYGQ